MHFKCLPQFAIRPELKFEKFMSKFALVTDVVAQVEILRFCRHFQQLFHSECSLCL